MIKRNRLASWLAWPLCASALSAVAFGPAHAAETPEPSERDARVRYITYDEDQVTLVKVRRGVVTRIILGEHEQIERAGTGFASECGQPELEWCIAADEGTNQVWVKPKDNATHNNLELRTNRRDYSFEFKVLEDSPSGRGQLAATKGSLHAEPMFRVIMRYKVPVPQPGFLTPASAPGAQLSSAGGEDLTARLEKAPPQPRNWNYTMEVLEGAQDIKPSLIFDDGRFTYFRFPGNVEVPGIFYIDPRGNEARLNFHMEGDLAVVQRMGRRFVLRLGGATIGVWNEDFDVEGAPPVHGTTVQGVERAVR